MDTLNVEFSRGRTLFRVFTLVCTLEAQCRLRSRRLHGIPTMYRLPSCGVCPSNSRWTTFKTRPLAAWSSLQYGSTFITIASRRISSKRTFGYRKRRRESNVTDLCTEKISRGTISSHAERGHDSLIPRATYRNQKIFLEENTNYDFMGPRECVPQRRGNLSSLFVHRRGHLFQYRIRHSPDCTLRFVHHYPELVETV